jgi:aminomuconate-semialdehyde/2-hydroxymuconate-6-semialdehyde dehydrogenase
MNKGTATSDTAKGPAATEITTISNYIDGKLIAPQSAQYLDVYNPSIGQVYAKLPDSDERDVQLATEAARKAFPQWAATPAEKRSQILMKIVSGIEKQFDKLVLAESIDNGKPVKLAHTVDIPRAASNFFFYASALMHFASESHSMEEGAINYTLRKPIGVVGCISPWNLPLYLFTWKIAPALATGNCVVAKPSEITPMTAYLLSEICIEAGLPPGVLNIVHGLGNKVGQAISEHPQIPAISFTGGTVTGAHIAKVAAPMFKKLSLELGGKNPAIIFADCNYEQMLKTVMRSSFANQGQICLCGSRIFIERPIYEQFKKDFVEKTKQLKTGDPLEEASNLGAVVSEAHMSKILSYVDLAKQEGGKILTGGKRAMVGGRCENGWFVEPTIIEGLAYDCRTNQEEIFGPVVTIMPFDTEEEVLGYANSTQYGLASTVWTENLTRAHRIANELKTGIIWINCWLLRDLRTPFGGMKNSGVGREGGWEAMRFFTEPKNVCIKY